jgi:hypothetical protein
VSIVAMEQIDDAGFLGWNAFRFVAVNVYGRVVALANT